MALRLVLAHRGISAVSDADGASTSSTFATGSRRAFLTVSSEAGSSRFLLCDDGLLPKPWKTGCFPGEGKGMLLPNEEVGVVGAAKADPMDLT
jgi:hypothetical protein